MALLFRGWRGQPKDRKGVSDEISVLSTRKEQLEVELVRLVPSFAAMSRRFAQKPDQLMAQLARNQAFVEFCQYPDGDVLSSSSSYGAFVISADKGIQFVRLGESRQINQLVAEFRKTIVESDRELTALGERLKLATGLPYTIG